MNNEQEQPQASWATPRYIRCPDCGEQIEMVPVLSQMIEAIEAHTATHKGQAGQFKGDLSMPHPRPPQIEENLAEQVLQRAAEISDVLGKNQNWVNHQ
jgi:hypothetical protein